MTFLRLRIGLLALCLLLVVYGAWVYQSIPRDGDSWEALYLEALPREGAETEADRLFRELREAGNVQSRPREIWGNFFLGRFPEPSQESVQEILVQTQSLREMVLERVTQEFEESEEASRLAQEFDFLSWRLTPLMIDAAASLLHEGRDVEAADVLAASARLLRIRTRKVPWPYLQDGRLELSGMRRMASMIARNLALHRFRPESLDRIDTLLETALADPLDLGEIHHRNQEVRRRLLEAYNRRLGLARFPLRLKWGNGYRQITRLQEIAAAGRSPEWSEVQGWHPMIQRTVTDLPALGEKMDRTRLLLQGVRLAVQLERVRLRTGRLPGALPRGDGAPEGATGWLYRPEGEAPLLYHPGTNGEDQGGDWREDFCVWCPPAKY